MGMPCTGGYLHVREKSRKGRVLRRAGVDAETDLICSCRHVADAHLAEMQSIGGALDTIVILATREAIPHGFHLRRNSGRSPVRVATISNDRTEVLELLVFVLYRSFEPVLTIQIHHNAALVKTMMALREIGLDHKREEPLVGLHLQDRRIVITEMVIRPLPEIRVRFGGDGNHTVFYLDLLRIPRPHHLIIYLFKSHIHTL